MVRPACVIELSHITKRFGRAGVDDVARDSTGRGLALIGENGRQVPAGMNVSGWLIRAVVVRRAARGGAHANRVGADGYDTDADGD